MYLNEIYAAILANAQRVREAFAKEYPAVVAESFAGTFTEDNLTSTKP